MKPTLSNVIQDIPEAMSVKFNMMVYDLQRQGVDIIVLSLGESFFDIPLFSFHRLKNWDKGYHYSSSFGLPDLREKISELYRQEYGILSNSEKEVLISAGSKIVIYLAFLATLNPGDEVIVFEPAWVSYPEQIRLSYGVPVMLPYYESLNNLKKYLNKRTRAIVINNPNNPSGKVYSKKELEIIFNFAKKHNLYIISDEAYSDFVLKKEPFISMGHFDSKKERVIIVNSLSKNLGMSGWRIGYVIANEKIIKAILKANQHLITCPTTLIEYYLIEYLDRILKITKPQIKAVVHKRLIIQKFMDKIGLGHLGGSGTFYFMVSIEGSRLNSEKFATRLLKEYHIATVPGVGYGKSLDKFLRVGVGTESTARIKKGLLAIQDLIKQTK